MVSPETDSQTIAAIAGNPAALRRETRGIIAVLCCTAAVVAGWLTLGDMQRLNHADSLIPVFISLYRWTWFYWEQGRFGMLTPLLAMPIRHPLWNLLFQNWIATFCGLMVFPLGAAYFTGWRTARLAGLVAASVFLLCGPDCLHMDYLLDNQPYGVSICAGLVGLLVLRSRERVGERTRLIVAMVLMFVSFWVSLATVFLILPLYTVESVARKKRVWAFALPGGLVIILAAFINWGISLGCGVREDFGWTSPLAWPSNTSRLLANTVGVLPRGFLVAIGVLLGSAVGSRDLRQRPEAIRAFLLAVFVAFIYLGIVAASDHVREGGFPYRYAIPSVVLVLIATAMFATWNAVEALGPQWARRLEGILVVGLLAGITIRYGVPSYRRVERDVDERFGGRTRAILESRCTHVTGDYWDVWGSVFHANLVLYEACSRNVVWAITGRSGVTKDLWFPLVADGRIAVPRTAESERAWAGEVAKFGLPELKAAEELPRIRVLRPQR